MTKRLVTILVVSVLATLLLASFAFGRASFDVKRVTTDRSEQIKQLSFAHPERPTARVSTRLAGFMGPYEDPVSPGRVSIGSVAGDGSSAATEGPGIRVDVTWDDWQSDIPNRHVDFWNNTNIQFGYADLANTDLSTTRYGYNVYDAVAGNWPQGIDQGCEVQGVGDWGYVNTIALTPRGRVVLAGHQGPYGTPSVWDNRMYYQQASNPQSCTWGLGTGVPKSSYSTWRSNPADTSREFWYPAIDLQVIGTDTVTHLAGIWWGGIVRSAPNPAGLYDAPVLYYKKLGQGQAGTWLGPIVIDSVYAYTELVCSRVGSKVAIVYMRTSDTGYVHGEAQDEMVCYRESIDGGDNWGPRTIISPWDRSVASISPWLESQSLYDMNGNLHIVYNAYVVPANPYTSGFDFNSLYNGSNIYHWSSSTGVNSLIYDATWDPSLLPGDLCGWIGYNALSTCNMSIGECAGRLYVFWSMANDMNTPGAPIDDCTSGGPPDDWRFYANADVFMSVSNDLVGNLWDSPRNITQTYTPKCDSATGNGVCMNDIKMSVSKYGFDSSSFATALIWPEAPLTMGGTITNDSTLQLFYMEDHYPGQYAVGAIAFQGKAAAGAMKWARLACISPISAPRIKLSPTEFGYPQFVNYGATNTHVITVANQGNDVLSVAQVDTVKANYGTTPWLNVSATSFTVPAASSGTFNLLITATPFFTSGTVWSLNGSVVVHSNVPTADSVKSISITNYLVADTVVGLVWDTLSTTCTRLIVSSNGDMGQLGFRGYNLDYYGTRTDCDTNTIANSVYLYSGGPMVIKKTGSSYVFSSMLHQGTYTTTQAMKNIEGTTTSSTGTADYDRFYTGNMVNRDTSIVLSRTYYAPKSGNCNFIVVESKYWGRTGSVPGVMISEIIDWDIPTDTGSNNISGVSLDGGFVYQRGIVSTDTSSCTDSARFGTQALLGYFNKSEIVGADTCKNNDTPFGMYAQLNDSVFKYDTAAENVEAGYFWDKDAVGNLTALGPSVHKDQHMVLTILRNTTLSPTDTLVVYTALSSVRQGTLTDLEANVAAAKLWYGQKLRHPACNFGTGCCVGSVGNCDGDVLDIVDVGDLTALIDNLFINFTPLLCQQEGNCDGSLDGIVDVGDLTALIDNLFINFTVLPACQ